MQSVEAHIYFVTRDTDAAQQSATVYTAVLAAKRRRPITTDNLLLKDEKEKRNNEQTTHKTAHLQIPQSDAKPLRTKSCFC